MLWPSQNLWSLFNLTFATDTFPKCVLFWALTCWYLGYIRGYFYLILKQFFDLNAQPRIQVLNWHKFSTLILPHDGVVAKSPIYFFCPKTNNTWAELFSTFYFFWLPIFKMVFCIFKIFYLQIVFCLRQLLNSLEFFKAENA